jgi:hypothetical protein
LKIISYQAGKLATSSTRIFNERNQKYTSFSFSVNSICQVAIVYLDMVSINKIGYLPEKEEITLKLLANSSSNSSL